MPGVETAPPKLAYSVDDLTTVTPFGSSKIYEEIAAGRLIACKNGRSTYFLPDDVRAWLEAGRQPKENQ